MDECPKNRHSIPSILVALATCDLVRLLTQQHMSVVLLNHQHAGAHLLAECVYVSAPTQEFKGGVGVTQAVERTVLPILVLQQALVKHQMTKSAVQPGLFDSIYL